MTKFNYSEVQGVFTSSQSDRVACLSSFSTVETNIAQFTATSALTGPGWDSAKQALSPYSIVTKALYNYHCDFGETYTAFLASFEGEVGETGKTLNTEELRALQEKLNRIQREKQDLLNKIAGNIALEIIGGYGVMAKDFQLGETQKKIDLLEKYETFENGHAGDFSTIVSTGGDLTTALGDLGKSKSFNAATGTYTYSDLKTKNWYTNLKTYNDSCPSQRIEIVKTDKYGYGLKVYINGQYSEVASTNLMYAQSKEGMKELGITMKDMAGEMTGLYSLYRLFNGKDPVTGEQASRLEAGLWTALLLLPQAKMVSAARELRAGNRLLTGANLTAKDLQILNKAGYFDDVGKIGKLEKAGGTNVPKPPKPPRNLIDNMDEIADDIRNINKKYSIGLEQNNSIDSIINSASYYEDVWEQTSAVTRGIAEHAFVDGNKRTAFDTLNMLLDDLRLKSPLNDTQKWDLINRIGTGDLKDVSEIANILKGK